MKKYYCDSSIATDDHWKFLLKQVLEVADTVEFNALSKGYKRSIEEYLPDEAYEVIESRKEKIYQSGGKIIRFSLTDRMKQFIRQKDYPDWKNFFIEDVSFLSNGEELLSAVTHESYVIMLLSEEQREKLNQEGFSFDVEWVI